MSGAVTIHLHTQTASAIQSRTDAACSRRPADQFFGVRLEVPGVDNTRKLHYKRAYMDWHGKAVHILANNVQPEIPLLADDDITSPEDETDEDQ